MIVLNKIDLNYDAEELIKKIKLKFNWYDNIFVISAVTGSGCKELANAIAHFLNDLINGQKFI